MARDIRLDDLEITVAQLTNRLEVLERHNAEHCPKCLNAAWERAQHQHFHEQAAAVQSREAERARLIRERAQRARVRITPVDNRSMRGKTREVEDPSTGVRMRQTFVLDGRGLEGPIAQVMLESDWKALLDDDDTAREALHRGFLRVEQLTLDERLNYEREHFAFPFPFAR